MYWNLFIAGSLALLPLIVLRVFIFLAFSLFFFIILRRPVMECRPIRNGALPKSST